jgi:hypothetical protein
MKKFILILSLLVSSSAFADNFMRVQDVNSQVRTSFASLADCQAGGNQCVKVDGVDLDTVDLKNGALVPSQTKIDAKAQAAAQAEAQRQAMLAKISALKALVGKSLSQAEQKQALEQILSLMFDPNLSLAAELLRLSAQTK